MDTFSTIRQKLEQFIRKYCLNELLKGVILFLSIGLLYLLVTLLVEYFLWLPSGGRTVLFWLFVGVVAVLFFRFVARPVLKLFKLQKGLSAQEASRMIGHHFPEVGDKLTNVLQLADEPHRSELLLAGIEQKSEELHPIPFVRAVSFKTGLRYLKYAAIPMVIYLVVTLVTGRETFSGSYERVVNYNIAYEPPAPFSFHIENEKLETVAGKPFTLHVQTVGTHIPENAAIEYDGQVYYLEQTAPGTFQYTFSSLSQAVSFRFVANRVTSRPYRIDVIKAPQLTAFEMRLDYPRYTGKQNEVVENTGNAVVPEGTRITWNARTAQTEEVKLFIKDTTYLFDKDGDDFSYLMRAFSTFGYTVTTSNRDLPDYENLSFTLRVVKDRHPQISVEAKQDSIRPQTTYFVGNVSDDYGLTRLQLVWHPVDDEKNLRTEPLPVSNSNFDRFFYTFPGNLDLEEGGAYSYYFEVFDNDGVNGPKRSRSTVFSYREPTRSERERQQLEQQSETIQGMNRSVEQFREQRETLDRISRTQKEKTERNWNDRQQLKEFLERQGQHEQMMKRFSEEMQQKLEEFRPDEAEDPLKENLQERFQRNEEQLEESERQMDELRELWEKLEDEELMERLEEQSQQNKNRERNLQQLVELTKRFYIQKKAEKLAEDLRQMSEEQEKRSEETEIPPDEAKEKQDALNEQFDDYRKEMEELREENQNLHRPMEIPDQSGEESEVQKQQQEASDKLEQNDQQGASQNQQNAAEKMKQMSQGMMQMQMMSGDMESVAEDARALRQILENLIIFSHAQEELMLNIRGLSARHPDFGKRMIEQHDLKRNFQHIDDSLFALALRNPMIDEYINEKVGEAHYQMDKALEFFPDNQVNRGLAAQQYTMTAANDLAILLAQALNSMQMQMQMMGSGSGQGKPTSGQGGGFQLPDIIQQQESLIEGMEEGVQDSENGEGESEGEGEGEGDDGGEEGGKDGRQGDQGEGGSGGNTEGGNGVTDDQNEEMSRRLFEIYMQQQKLRIELEDRLRREGIPADAARLLRQMEQVENELLRSGFNKKTLQSMQDIKHRLLQLDEAAFQQEEREERKGTTAEDRFRNTTEEQIEQARRYFNDVEILNRESLPLRQEYLQRVQRYFNNQDQADD